MRDIGGEIDLSLEKLSLLSLTKKIEPSDVDETIGVTTSAKVFDLVDSVMR
jgi:DNA polymerase III delta subunit